MKPTASKVGRRRSRRLQEIDADFLRTRIIEVYGTLTEFYKETIEETKKSMYKGFPRPSDLDSVSSAFYHAFSGHRALPPIYWKVLEEFLSINEKSLPSTKTETTSDAASSSPIPIQEKEAGTEKLRSASLETLRGQKSLADWFLGLSSVEILRYIKTIQFAPKPKIASIYEELTDPHCINVVAEKMVEGPIDIMVKLVWEYRHELKGLVFGVCVAIDTDSLLRAKHSLKVAQCDFIDLLRWFNIVAGIFGEFDFGVIRDVENCFVQFAATPEFGVKHKADDLETFCYAISGFAKFGCKRAIKVLSDSCFKNNSKLIKQAAPSKVKEFVSLIGEKVFRPELERSIGPGDAANLIRSLG